MAIHPTSIIEKGAKVPASSEIGPFCHIGPEVQLGENVKIVSHVSISGITRIGDNTKIFPFASIGHAPQDLKYHGERSELIIGKNNTIREHVTMNPGTETGAMKTIVGDNCLFMMGSHVAHDCVVGNNVILANNATLAGHVEVGDNVIIGGLSAVRQFVKIGKNAMIGGMSGIENDVIPYGNAFGERAFLNGLNLIGLKRKGIEKEELNNLRSAFRDIFYGDGTLAERLEEADDKYKDIAPVQEILEFIKANEGKNALCQPRKTGL